MRRALPHLSALLLGVAAALAVGCGDRSNLIPPNQAGDLKDRLAAVRAAVDAGDCPAAQDALGSAKSAATRLPNQVDRRLRRRINDGIRSLEDTVPKDCAAATQTVDTTTTETTTTETVPTTTTAPTTTQAPPTTTQVPTTTTTVPPTPTVTTPPATTPAPDNGGTPGDTAP